MTRLFYIKLKLFL